MDKLNSKYKAVLSICDLIESYIDDIGENIETRIYDKALDTIKKADYGDDIFYKFVRIKLMLEGINDLLTDLKNVNIPNISNTRKMELSTLCDKLYAKYLALNKDLLLIDVDTMNNLVKLIITDITEEKIYEYRKFYHNNRGCINIYANLMQQLVDHYFISNKSLAFKLLAMVEEDKDMVLSGSVKKQFKSTIKKNPRPYRYGLLPVTPHLALKDILNIIAKEVGKPISGTDFKKISNKFDIGIIVFNKIVYTPVEINTRPLIIEEEAKPFIQPNAYGINKKVITRFNTITQLKSTDTWDFSIEKYNENAKIFYILETTNGNTYKLLAPWLKSDKYGVSSFRIMRVLTENPASRSVDYHAKKINNAIPNMFAKKMLDLESVEERNYDIDSNVIRNAIIADIMRTVHSICSKKFKNGFKNSTEVSNLLHDPEIVDTYINSALIHYAKGANNYDAGDFDISEILSTFLVMLQETGRRFLRELHNGYARDPIKDEIFDGSKTTRDNIVMERVLNIINNTMSLIIKLDSNPFVHIYTKYIKLNFEM